VGEVTRRKRTYVSGELVTAGGRVERTVFDGLAADELVNVLRLEVEQLLVARRRHVHQLILHVELGHREHCSVTAMLLM